MSRRAPRLLVLAALLPLAACPNDEPAPPWLSRVTPEPAGANCAAGGDAIQVGPDEDGDGVLDAGEVESTQYRCAGAAPVLLTRSDVEPAGANCADGGAAVRAGRDTDGDGVLDDGEVEHTTYACGVDTVWEGDLVIGRSNVDAVRHVQVVTGSLRVSLDDTDLPALALVGGDLELGGGGGTTLSALAVVAGSFRGGNYLGSVGLPALTAIGGDLEPGSLPVLEAPVLRTVGGDLVESGNYSITAVRLPQLTTIGGDLHLESCRELAELSLGALTELGGSLILDDNPALLAVALPQLTSITGDVTTGWSGALARLELPALAVIGGRIRLEGDRLTTVALPRLGAANDVRIASEALAVVDLGSLARAAHVGIDGSIRPIGGPARGSIVALDLGALAQIDSLSLGGFATLEELALPSLQLVDGDLNLDVLGAVEHIDAPALLAIDRVKVENAPALRSLAITGNREHSYVRDVSLIAVGPLDGERTVLPLMVGTVWVRETAATSLAWLGGVIRMQRLDIDRNAALTSVTGLHPQVAIAELEIYANPALTSLRGLEHLTSLTGDLTIEQTGVVDLDGLSGLTTVGGDAHIVYNGALVRVGGLALESVGGNLSVSGNNELASLGLGALTYVGGDLALHGRSLPAAEIEALRARLGR